MNHVGECVRVIRILVASQEHIGSNPIIPFFMISNEDLKMLMESKWWFYAKYLPTRKMLGEFLHAIRRPMDYRLREWVEFIKGV